MAVASDWTSFTPPTPRSAADTADTEAATFDSDSELRVAVTTMSARPSVGGTASCAIAGIAIRAALAMSRPIGVRRDLETAKVANWLRTMINPLNHAALKLRAFFIYWRVDTGYAR